MLILVGLAELLDLKKEGVVKIPLYEFMCDKCLKITTELLRITSKKQIIKCDKCGEERAKRIISAPSGYDMKGYSEANGYSNKEKK